MSHVQWFPGHMRRAVRGIEQRIRRADLVIEVLDARAPQSTHSPLLAELASGKRVLRVLAKHDLADTDATASWLRSYASGTALALTLSGDDPTVARRVKSVAVRLASAGRGKSRPVYAVVVGIPNVGKSTLINRLAGRRKTIARNEPGVTRQEQAIAVMAGLMMWDTPGVLSADIPDQSVARRLAALGALSTATFDVEEVAAFLADYLALHYPIALKRVYGVVKPEEGAEQVIDAIAKRRGYRGPGNTIDTTRAARTLLHDFGTGRLGRVSLESCDVESPSTR